MAVTYIYVQSGRQQIQSAKLHIRELDSINEFASETYEPKSKASVHPINPFTIAITQLPSSPYFPLTEISTATATGTRASLALSRPLNDSAPPTILVA